MIIIDDADVKQEVKEEKSKPDKKKKRKVKIVKGTPML